MCVCLGSPESHTEEVVEDCPLSVSPLVEAEMMRIDSVLSNFAGESSCDVPPVLRHQTPQRVKSCKKRMIVTSKPARWCGIWHTLVLGAPVWSDYIFPSCCTRAWAVHWCMKRNKQDSFFLSLWITSAGGLGVRTAGRGLRLCDVTNLSPAACGRFCSDARCFTPVPARKRRCTMTVDYKEPSLNAWVPKLILLLL